MECLRERALVSNLKGKCAVRARETVNIGSVITTGRRQSRRVRCTAGGNGEAFYYGRMNVKAIGVILLLLSKQRF